MPDVSLVSSPVGTFVGGQQTGPPTGNSAIDDGSAYLTVATSAPLFSDISQTQLDRLHAVGRPTGAHVQLAGAAQSNRDTGAAVTKRLPIVVTMIVVTSTLLLFLLTGSVMVPLKTMALNALSLTATFGALAWIWHGGHPDALGTTHKGTLDFHMPLLLFCVAFGLSMNYEVFLISRIREFRLSSEQTRADNDESVALGLAHAGRVIAAAAPLMSIAFAALLAPQVSFMRMFDVGLALAILVDATLVRLMLVPTLMQVLGRANWWVPGPLARLYNRVGLADSVRYGRHAAPNPLGHPDGRELSGLRDRRPTTVRLPNGSPAGSKPSKQPGSTDRTADRPAGPMQVPTAPSRLRAYMRCGSYWTRSTPTSRRRAMRPTSPLGAMLTARYLGTSAAPSAEPRRESTSLAHRTPMALSPSGSS